MDGKITNSGETYTLEENMLWYLNIFQHFPRELQWMTYLKEWHIRDTKIRQLPDYLALFTQLTVLEIPKNTITELPPEIGEAEKQI